jgi:membrane dipeptidase
MDRVIAMIQFAVDVMGIDSVAIGTHFNTASMPWITEGLIQAGYADDHIAKIMGGNYIRVLKQVLPPGERNEAS